MSEQTTVDGVKIFVNYENSDDMKVSEQEMRNYISRAYDRFPHGKLESLTLDVDGEEIGISYGLAPAHFDRIRRITGYLVGTLDRFNDAKRAEEHDRVKHQVCAKQ